MKEIRYTLRCPDCAHRWKQVLPADAKMPEYCPSCGHYIGPDDPEAVPQKIAIGGSAIARAADQTYRQLEESSAARAEMLGDPALKITNMRDHVREGETCAMPVQNAVTQYQDSIGATNFSQTIMAGTPAETSVGQILTMAKMGQERTTGARGLKWIQDAGGPEGGGIPQISSAIRGSFGGKIG